MKIADVLSMAKDIEKDRWLKIDSQIRITSKTTTIATRIYMDVIMNRLRLFENDLTYNDIEYVLKAKVIYENICS